MLRHAFFATRSRGSSSAVARTLRISSSYTSASGNMSPASSFSGNSSPPSRPFSLHAPSTGHSTAPVRPGVSMTSFVPSRGIFGFGYNIAKKIMPKISATERAALDSGTVGFDRSIFDGTPSLAELKEKYGADLSTEEAAFLEGETEELCAMVDDYAIGEAQNLPPEVWDFIRTKGFLGLIIPKEFGGKGFSALGHSMIVQKISSVSAPVAVTVMVPNSLGPGELLLHYGTEAQRNKWLPRLAGGQDIPCFGLTGPPSGSDAASMRDHAVVCRDDNGNLALRATFNKRYITLAPVAGCVGLAVRVSDPDGLLDTSSGAAEGITVALLPRNLPGLEIGPRHNPLDTPFMNGTIRGTDVMIPVEECVIGGQSKVGFGWNMLMECLGEGRGISLPAMASATNQVCVAGVAGYARIRKQFKTPIADMEGVQEKLGEVAAGAYTVSASQRLFNSMLAEPWREKPPVLSAIMKRSATDTGRNVLTAGMDVLGGAAICNGPSNFMANNWKALPIAITVEGANILTRSLIIFGQGLNRSHPHMLPMVETIIDGNDLPGFRKHLIAFLKHAGSNAGRSLTRGPLSPSLPLALKPHPSDGKEGEALVAHWDSQLQRIAANFALVSDLGCVLGGKLKVAEFLSGRYADVLSNLYQGYAVLWYRSKYPAVASLTAGSSVASSGFGTGTGGGYSEAATDAVVDLALQRLCYESQEALLGIFANFPAPFRPVAWLMKALTFPLGRAFSPPSDAQVAAASSAITNDTAVRRQLMELVYLQPGSRLALIDEAFPIALEADNILRKARKEGRRELDQLTKEEREVVDKAEEMREEIIQVDSFARILGEHKLPEMEVGGGRKLKLSPSFSHKDLTEDKAKVMGSSVKGKGEQDGEREEANAAIGW